MPYRKTPIAVGEIYHVFNRSIASQPIFLSPKDYQRALDVFIFYLYSQPPLRFSFYNRLPREEKEKFLNNLIKTHDSLAELVCFCLMPNHMHFLLKNLKDKGISTFMRKFQDSYAKYFNTKTTRVGTLFQPMFKAVRIESNEQLIHVSRYIHLNPATAYLVKTEDLKMYPWSSYPYYINATAKTNSIANYIKKDVVLGNFKSAHAYEQFVLDQVDYQRQLDRIKHLTLEL